MMFQPRPAHLDCLVVFARLAELLSERRERDRRRVFLDPAPQFVQPLVSVHDSAVLSSR
jgi:hypothetical protein